MYWRQSTLDHFYYSIILMIINDLNVERITFDKAKTNSPLIVNSNTPLALPIAFQCFQLIRRWKFQIPDLGCGIELGQSPNRALLDIGRNPFRSARCVK